MIGQLKFITMFMTLLFLSHASAEWVEINQQHYLKPVKVIQNPAFINTPSKDSQETSISFEKPDDKEDKIAIKPNRIYINHTILGQGWNDDIFTDSSENYESSTKLTRKFRPHGNSNKNLDKQNNLAAEKVLDKRVKVKEIVRVTDKRLNTKNTEAKITDSKKPNRIYVNDDVHSGSLEVYELSDLEKLAEEDSEEYFRKNIQFQQTSPANVLKNEETTKKIEEKHEDHAIENRNNTRKKTKEPSKLFNTNTLRRVDIIKNSDNEHVIQTDTAPEKSVAFIKKHMVAKITKVDIPISTKTSTEKNKIGSQVNEHVENEVKSKGTEFNKNGQSVIKTTNSETSHVISIISTSTTNKPSDKNKRNRYEHHGAIKSEKVPDPEAIMIKEILNDNDDTDVTSSSTEKGDKDDSGKKVVGDTEYKKHAKTKGQKAPDPDAAMIQELLSEVAQMSHETITDKKHQVNDNVGSIQIADISTRKPSKKSTTQIPIKKDNTPIVKKTDMIPNQINSQETSVKTRPVPEKFKQYHIIKNPGTIYDDDQPSSQEPEEYYTTLTTLNNLESDKKTDKIGKIPDTNYDDDVESNTEKLIVLTTPKNKTHTSTEKGSIKFDSRDSSYKPVKIHTTSTEKGSIEFDSREYSYKPVIRLHEEKPEFVSKEDFFTESQVVDLQENYSEPEQLSTIEPVIPSTDNILDLSTTDSVNNEQTSSKNKEVKVDKTVEPKEDEKKASTMENVVKLLKVVTDIIARNTRNSLTSKVRYLEGLKDTLLANIEERIEAAFPSPTRTARSGHAPAPLWSSRGHVDFPSSESALMTISFLTFAVFLVKLVLQVIHTYKSKTAIPSVVAAVGRAAGRWQHGRN